MPKRQHKKCVRCERPFSILPRQDGKPQRDQCFKCKRRAPSWQYKLKAKPTPEAEPELVPEVAETK